MSEQLSAEDFECLRHARNLLENPSVAARVANAIGIPIETALAHLPQFARDAISAATTRSLQAALDFAVSTMDDQRQEAANWVHKTIVAVTGAAGGAFGLPALAIELPISTTIMLRSIADIARSEGEQIKLPEVKLACLEVFALSGRTGSGDASESGYFAIRAALAKTLSEAAQFITERGIAEKGAPAVLRFITQVAVRFGIPVSEKVAAQSIPIVGAAGGALINTLFIDHFQDIARGHFIVRRLQRQYGAEFVKEEYLRLPAKAPDS